MQDLLHSIVAKNYRRELLHWIPIDHKQDHSTTWLLLDARVLGKLHSQISSTMCYGETLSLLHVVVQDEVSLFLTNHVPRMSDAWW